MRLVCWIGALAIAVGTGACAGSAFSFLRISAVNRDDPFLVGIGWLAAAAITAGGLAAITDLFASPKHTPNTTQESLQ